MNPAYFVISFLTSMVFFGCGPAPTQGDAGDDSAAEAAPVEEAGVCKDCHLCGCASGEVCAAYPNTACAPLPPASDAGVEGCEIATWAWSAECRTPGVYRYCGDGGTADPSCVQVVGKYYCCAE